MSERGPGFSELSEAVVEESRRFSLVWLIPLVAVLAGAFVAWRAFSERGPEITIELQTAEGLEAGKTKVRYKDVEVGLVEKVSLADDLSHVICRARMVKGAERFLHEGTRFWVVRARVAGGQVTGLGTVFSGAYLGMDPVREGKPARRFRALDEAPIVTTDEPGRHFVLRSYRAGAPETGTPVYYRRIPVGRVLSSELDPSGDFVTVRVFVHAPHDARVRLGTHFWNASGIDVSLSAEGLRVDTESVVSLLVGGVAFDSPDDAGEPAPDGQVFPLYESRDATQREVYTEKTYFQLHFDQSVRGLEPGAPVELRGIRVGQVRDVKLEYDAETNRFRIPVVVEMEPQRVAGSEEGMAERRERLDRLVAAGLRAQLKTGSLVTGQLLVSLDMHPDAPPAHIDWSGTYPEFPTIPTPIEEITASLTKLAQRLGTVPVDELAADLRRSIQQLESLAGTIDRKLLPRLDQTLTQAGRALAATDDLLAPDSTVNNELRRALVELGDAARSLGLAADQIQRDPQSLLFGKGNDQ